MGWMEMERESCALLALPPSLFIHQVHKHFGRFLAIRGRGHVQLDPVRLGGGKFDALKKKEERDDG